MSKSLLMRTHRSILGLGAAWELKQNEKLRQVFYFSSGCFIQVHTVGVANIVKLSLDSLFLRAAYLGSG